MRKIGKLTVIGSGPSALYFLNHLSEGIPDLRDSIDSIVIFEKTALAGYGMPYHPETTDRYNRANISSEELPHLPEKFASWLQKRDREELARWGIEKEEISESEVYGRLALGEYFHNQFEVLVTRLQEAGIPVDVFTSCAVKDIEDDPEKDRIRIFTDTGTSQDFDTVVIATGHFWQAHDKPSEGFYSSPWPIFKFLPNDGEFLNHSVGTLGASLSAFDVISSLANRHGLFEETNVGMSYQPYDGTENFELVMHSSEGWLPHLQWDQVQPLRKIYRHISREKLLSLREKNGYLRLENYFDQVCRPALREAFLKDELHQVVKLISDPSYGIEEFVEEMTERHQYADPFEGMRQEFGKARDSVENHHPIHWKETLDDLMYCLNYHAELLPAEDHMLFKKIVSPFLMNVIAAMPLQSAKMLLALHEVQKVRLVAGKVKIQGAGKESGTTRVTVEDEHGSKEIEYRMFIDCSGQKPIEIEVFPFHSLAENGSVRDARADFLDQKKAEEIDADKRMSEEGVSKLRIGGIDIDAAYRVISKDGLANPRIHDLSFPHTSGLRPYSYGLQACSATAGIVVNHWLEAIKTHGPENSNLTEVSKNYHDL
ncbi:MAG: FAD/NAD(P)-binding protein [Verrucomicrobiota bacterium]